MPGDTKLSLPILVYLAILAVIYPYVKTTDNLLLIASFTACTIPFIMDLLEKIKNEFA